MASETRRRKGRDGDLNFEDDDNYDHDYDTLHPRRRRQRHHRQHHRINTLKGAIRSLGRVLSPTHNPSWSRRTRGQIACNASGAYHVYYVLCSLVKRDGSAFNFERFARLFPFFLSFFLSFFFLSFFFLSFFGKRSDVSSPRKIKIISGKILTLSVDSFHFREYDLALNSSVSSLFIYVVTFCRISWNIE